ncbi:hypothetical protein FBUS_00633 [Fasciolopsis buskii]|uniref:Uncharacterized protein n=1 Tax=Fasciolopsis buskii TaxID=27845 RepID=A0A8E0RV83_9TREM|nr:hypothetical protein FBUS_00633 [Fasciolopsis buski]
MNENYQRSFLPWNQNATFQILSQAPLVNSYRRLSTDVSKPCRGYHDFHLKIPTPGKPGSCVTTHYQVIEPTSRTDVPQICVPRGRQWPMTIAFRPSVTPLDWWLRVTPVFTDAERAIHPVERNEHTSEYDILGLQKVRVRCCACPARDAKEARIRLPRSADSPSQGWKRSEQKASRCLSLSIPSKRNVRAVRTVVRP